MMPGKIPANTLSQWLLLRMREAKKRRRVAIAFRILRRFAFLQRFAARLRERAGEAKAFNPQKIEDVAHSRNALFFSAAAAANSIEGMFSNFSMAVVDTLLAFQRAGSVKGNLLEFGVFKGRSAALLGRHLDKEERLVLVDITDHLDRSAIAPFRKSVDLVFTPTEEFKSTFRQYDEQLHTFRFIHIDASHDYRATFTELQVADELLGGGGIIALDDFANLNYSQNLAAIFKYLYTTSTDLTAFLVTDEKAYLCRKDDFTLYAGFVLDGFLTQMSARDVGDCVLARTDVDPEYGAIYARGRLPGEVGHHYGIAIDRYRNNFRHP